MCKFVENYCFYIDDLSLNSNLLHPSRVTNSITKLLLSYTQHLKTYYMSI